MTSFNLLTLSGTHQWVKKKNNTYRFACDYRALNNIIIPMSFPLPHIESVFDAIGEARASYFTSLDLMSGFWQME